MLRYLAWYRSRICGPASVWRTGSKWVKWLDWRLLYRRYGFGWSWGGRGFAGGGLGVYSFFDTHASAGLAGGLVDSGVGRRLGHDGLDRVCGGLGGAGGGGLGIGWHPPER